MSFQLNDGDIKILIETLKTHPNKKNELYDIIEDNYNNAFQLQDTNPLKGNEYLNIALNELFIVKNNIPAEINNSPEEHLEWSTKIDNLFHQTNKLKTKIQSNLLKDKLIRQIEQNTYNSHSKTVANIIMTEWTNPTLQEPFYIKTFTELGLPLKYPTIFSFNSKVCIIEGESNTGKTYALKHVQSYLEQQYAQQSHSEKKSTKSKLVDVVHREKNFKFYELDVYDFSTKIEMLEKEINENKGIHHFLVTEILIEQLNMDSAVLMRWLSILNKSELNNIHWIILCRDKKNIHPEIFNRTHPVVIEYQFPSSKTIYHYLLSHLKSIYGSSDESFINIPILQNDPQLSKLAIELEKLNFDFNRINNLVENARKRCVYLGLRENAVYEIKNQLYLKNSIKFPVQEKYEYYMLNDNNADYLNFVSEENGSKAYWNCNILDNMPSVEDDRLIGIWINLEHNKEDHKTLDLIASFDVEQISHPYHLNSNSGFISETILNLYCSLVKNAVEYDLATSEIAEFYNGIKSYKNELRVCLSMENLLEFSSLMVENVFLKNDKYPTLYNGSNGEFINKLSQQINTNIQYISLEPRDEEKIEECKFNISYGENTSLKSHPEGIVGNIKANEMKKIIKEISDIDTHIIQVSTHNGYFWKIEFPENVLPKKIKVTPFEQSEEMHVFSFPSISLLQPLELDLPYNYCITNESDVDILSENFAKDFEHCYRDEEETWMLKSLEKKHVDFLNGFYVPEQKFYLRFYYHLLKSRTEWLSEQQTDILDELIGDVRDYVEFILLLSSDTDDKNEWSGYWSISDGNPLFGFRENRIYSQNTSSHFGVSPMLLIKLLQFVTDNYEEKKSFNEIYNTFLLYKRNVHEREQKIIYVKSKIDKQVWADSIASLHRLPNVKDIIRDPFVGKKFDSFMKFYKHSLYYNLFINAELIGVGVQSNKIRWYSFSEDQFFDSILNRFRTNPQLWTLNNNVNINIVSWVYSLILCCLESNQNINKIFLANLFYFPEFLSSEKDENQVDLLGSLFTSSEFKSILKKYIQSPDVELPTLLVYKTETNGPLNIGKTKKIIAKERINQINVYGLDINHFLEQL